MILAVDPGMTGGLALYDEQGKGLVGVYKMPTYKMPQSGERKFLDEEALWRLMGACRVQHGASRLVCEKVNGIAGQSAGGAFTFGYGVGALIMAGRALGMRIDRVQPAMWKRAMRCPASKEASRIRASEVFPEQAGWWPRKGDDGLAEAALIAKYAGDNLL